MSVNHVEGKKVGNIILYSLTTCPWCHKVRELLDAASVAYDYIDVDLTDGEERQETLSQVERYSPRLSFPVLLINNQVFIRYQEDEIQEGLRRALNSDRN